MCLILWENKSKRFLTYVLSKDILEAEIDNSFEFKYSLNFTIYMNIWAI
jgi:hypothetical protein